MPFAFSYPIIFCAYRLSTSMPRDNRYALPGIRFRKTYADTCFELTLTCLVLARLIFSRKKRCILWPFKLTSDLFFLVNENHFVNFTGATFALATHVYTSMHKSRLHQQVCRGTWKSILSQIFFNQKNPLITNVKRENNICLCTHFDNRITPRLS